VLQKTLGRYNVVVNNTILCSLFLCLCIDDTYGTIVYILCTIKVNRKK